MFINHSNHSSSSWDPLQYEEASQYGIVIDRPFPHISPTLSHEEVRLLVEEEGAWIRQQHPKMVMCQGEFTYTYLMVNYLKSHHIPVVAACSDRNVEEYLEGHLSKKLVTFKFIRFREY